MRIAMRTMALLMLPILSACAVAPGAGPDALQREIDSASAVRATGFEVPGYRDDVVTLIDTRAIRALRRGEGDVPGLDLTKGQKVALWVTVGVAASFLMGKWLEDNVAFFP
jgi:hypothetical protein